MDEMYRMEGANKLRSKQKTSQEKQVYFDEQSQYLQR